MSAGKAKHMSRNSELLKEFVSYCEAHPDMRFWQALTNWSGLPFVGWAINPQGEGFRDLWHAEGKHN